MILQGEARRRQGFHVSGARVNLENFAAMATMKMVMVRLARKFVAGRAFRDGDRGKKSLILKRLQAPIDRGDAEAWHIFPRRVEHFLWR